MLAMVPSLGYWVSSLKVRDPKQLYGLSVHGLIVDRLMERSRMDVGASCRRNHAHYASAFHAHAYNSHH